MVGSRYLSIALVFAAALSCGRESERAVRAPAEHASEIRSELGGVDSALKTGARTVGRGLRDLSDEQMASVAALITIARMASLMEGPATMKQAMPETWRAMHEVCPPLPKVDLERFGDCRDFDADYGVGMARCLDEGRSESDCEKENYGALEQAAGCRMKEIAALGGLIEHIPGGDWPPSPIPWPEDLLTR